MARRMLPTPCPLESETPPEAISIRYPPFVAPSGPDAWDLPEDDGPAPRPDYEAHVTLEPRGTNRQKTHRHREHHLHKAQPELWDTREAFAESVIAKLKTVGRYDLAVKLETCHATWTVAWCPDCGLTKKFPNRCENFFCARCQNRLSNERADSIAWWVSDLKQPKHVVLTVKNIKDLSPEHIDQFRSWFTRLRHRKFARNWIGGFYSLELSKSEHGWHLHLHALIEAKWIDQAQLANEWASINGGCGYIVRVKDCRGSDYLRQVLKYVVKGNQLALWSGQELATFIDAFSGKRTFAVFGQLHSTRTQFADWLKAERAKRPRCSCGSMDVKYYSEEEWIRLELQPDQPAKPRAPPAPPQTPELFKPQLTWPD